MSISQFEGVYGNGKLKFSDIWKIYDRQFAELRNAYLALGDKYFVEVFKDSINKNLTLEHQYRRGEVLVYRNDTILWNGESYIEQDPNHIRLTIERYKDDVIRVLILKTEIISDRIETYTDEIIKYCTSAVSEIEEAERTLNILDQLKIEVDDRVEEALQALRDAQDTLIEFDTGRYNEDDTLREVKLSRGIFKTLHDRLNMNDKRISRMVSYDAESETMIFNTKGPNPDGTVDVSLESLPYASADVPGIVKLGDSLKIDEDGVADVNAKEISSEDVNRIFDAVQGKDKDNS